MANFTALAAARYAVYRKANWDVALDGLRGAPDIRIIVGAEAHPTLFKSLAMLGFGRSQLTIVPVDKQGRLRTEAIQQSSDPTIICAQAGNINTGAFDDFQGIHEIAQSLNNCWVHVDGAFGLWAQAVPSLRHLCQGVETADSWATDGHKWLNVTYDSGFAFVKDSKALRAAMAISAEYLPEEGAFRNPSDYTPELSRRGRGIEVWATMYCLGRSGIVDMIQRCCRHAERFSSALSNHGLTILNDVVLNQVLVGFGDEARTKQFAKTIQQDGTCWCGATTWQGKPAIRISICSWATTEEDVDKSINAIINAVNKCKDS
jgi:glutamate/tyrosine decarboxylase-like PLP-dependent enzyme